MSNRIVSPALALMLALGCTVPAQGQEVVQRYEEYSKRLRDQDKVAPLKSDLFGDQVSLYNGATEFVVTDIDIPGNNALPVRLQRRLRIEPKKGQESFGGIGVWDVEVPYMVGSFSATTKWNIGGTPGDERLRRCTDVWYPYIPVGYNLNDIWSGTMIHVPGDGDRELLRRIEGTGIVPQDGQQWHWAARDDMRLRCKPNLANPYEGEGFIAVDAKGTKYTFDFATERRETAASTGGIASVGRIKVFLLATRVEDRYGNWVDYSYEIPPGASPGRVMLKRIQSSDNRRIDLTYSGDQLASATAHGRTWRYQYGAPFGAGPAGLWLNRVTLPDNSYWEYTRDGFLNPMYPNPDVSADGTCPAPPLPAGPQDGARFVLTARHPAGAQGIFTFDYLRQGRSGTLSSCSQDPIVPQSGEPTYSLVVPDYYDLYSLVSKTIVSDLRAPPLVATAADSTWTYAYDQTYGLRADQVPCLSCPDRKSTFVTAPDGSSQEHVFGFRYMDNDGRLLEVKTKSPAGELLRKVTTTYWTDFGTRPFPEFIGDNQGGDDPENIRNRPVVKTRIEQQGVRFSTSYADFDAFARPRQVAKMNSTSLETWYTENTTFYDNLQRWVLGQPASLLVGGINQPVYSLTYDPATDNPATLTRFGEFVQRYTYDMSTPGALGTLTSISDARNATTTLLDYRRGIPRFLGLPTGASESAVVNDWGNITSHTDAGQGTTQYSYDSLGRLSGITYPADDVRAWNSTQIEFVPVASAEYEIKPGHWRRTVSNGPRREVTYFDGLWRPVLSRQHDATDASAPNRFIARTFDYENRERFISYPQSAVKGVSRSAGSFYEYDALGRITKAAADSELGRLETTTRYEANFQKIVTNPRGLATTYSFQIFGDPEEKAPSLIQQPGGITTTILRDKMGKPTLIQRSGTFEGNAVSALRTYVYDSAERLCKRIEPETGATLFDYDVAGNIAWTTTGSALTSAACDRSSVPGHQRTARNYDYMNRPVSVLYPDAVQNLFTTYNPDGSVQSATAGDVTTNYTYAKRGMLLSETVVDPTTRYALGYDYNANGEASGMTYPDGKVVEFQPNAFGEPTRSGSYASGATYASTGVLKSFVYGNQVTYVASENERKLLGNFSYGLAGGQLLLSHDLKYDPNGNLKQIVDLVPGAQRSRSMDYDDADRLISVQAGAALGGPEAFSYDPLDNLRRATRSGSPLVYTYSANNRLDNVKNGSTTVASYAYDERGNAIARNGTALAFDRAERVSSVGSTSYLYDAQGRRHQRNQGGQKTNFIYSNAGQFLFEHDTASNKITRQHYLGSRLVARAEDTLPLPVAPVLSVPPTSGNGLYAVSWNAVPGAFTYRLEERGSNGVWLELGSITATSWSPPTAKANGTYYYRARACQFTCSAYSAEVNVVVGVVPVLTAPALGVNGAYTVSWTAVNGTAAYTLEEYSAGAWAPVYSGGALNSLFTQKPAGTYRYRVKACASQCGGYSNEGETLVLYAPTEAPLLTLPAQSTGSYVLNWTSVARATSYVVEQETNASNNWVVVAPDSGQGAASLLRSFAGQAVANYRYRVKAVNAAGSGPWSLIHAHTVHILMGVPVLTVPASNTTGSYSVSWTSVPSTTRYMLQEKKGSGVFVTVHNAAATSLQRTRQESATYTYKVRACSGASDTTCGAYSAEQAVSVTIAPPPVPTGLNAVAVGGGSSCRIEWNASPGAEIYEVRAGSALQYSGPETWFLYDAQCMGGYQVRAGYLGAWSAWSGQSSVPPTAAPTLSAPATNSTGAYTLSWTAVNGAEAYKLEESVNQGSWALSSFSEFRTASFSNKPNGSYRYRVSGCIESGACGPVSAIATVVVNRIPVPAAPTLSAPAMSTGAFSVSWTTPAHATTFNLKKSVSGGAWSEELPANSTATSKSYSGLPSGNYSFYVVACNSSGCSAASNLMTVSVQSSTGAPSIPANVRVRSTSGGAGCSVTWDPSTGTVTRYVVIDTFGSEYDAGPAALMDFDTPCTGYQVKACNVNVCSAPSEPIGP